MMEKKGVLPTFGAEMEGGGMMSRGGASSDIAGKAARNIYNISKEYISKWTTGAKPTLAKSAQQRLGADPGFTEQKPWTEADQAKVAKTGTVPVGQSLASKPSVSTPSSYPKTGKIEPLDWNAIQNKYAPAVELPPGAKEQGFNPQYPFYKGGGSPELRRQLPDPSKKDYERGQFFAEDPKVAKAYAHTGGSIHKYVAAPKNPAVIDLKGKGYDSEHMHHIIEEARDRGHDLVVIRNILDIGSGGRTQNQVVVTDPSIVRHPSAKFDPGSMHMSDVLAGILAGAAVGKTVKELNPKDEK
jgi:hypothetical protein